MARKKKKTYFGVIFWIASILVVLIVYLWNKPTITRVIEETGFMEVVKEKFSPAPTDKPSTENPAETKEPPKATQPEEKETEPTPKQTPLETPSPTPKPTKTLEKSKEPSHTTEETKKTINMLIYFAKVYDNGEVITAPVPRKIEYKDAPLTSTLKTLLAGPTETEKKSGIKNLIPEGTKLLGVSVKNRIAYINMSEDLRFNPLGQEGLLIELKQIVYTATQFPTVDKVQILIEGKIIPYLAPEGIPIGKPLKPDEI
ncbi:GerMN domain-containing protein [Spirochaetia bacterium 38H-sp]|uniref:GerMN domain-containing protein n=1 Tax=Rarispira pelagica TaxID=3141764 RepID=A0ABU9UBA4_9SPIR